MRGVIESITEENGRHVVWIRSEQGSRKLYGLPSIRNAIGNEVEFEMTLSRAGHKYARFIGYAPVNRGLSKPGGTDAAVTGQPVAGAFSTQSGTFGEMAPVSGSQPAGDRKPSSGNGTAEGASDEPACMTVSKLNEMIGSTMAGIPCFRDFWVKGEVTNYNGHTTHYYFDIKDEHARISCFLWERDAAAALSFTLKKGQEVAVRGSFEFYEPFGTSKIHVSRILNLGDGDAKLKYEQLKAKLQNEGLFDISHHKEIPRHAGRVGIVTSKNGQAIRDICKVAGERNPYVQLILYHVQVQGVRAVESIIEGIRQLDRAQTDVIIVGRGGGSDEELLVYDDEALVRTVFAAKTPIVSAVGHEGHTPLVDGVADLRVATPTDAAQHVIFDVMSEIRRVRELKEQIAEKAWRSLREKRMRLDRLQAELEKNSPEARLKERKNRLEIARERMRGRMDQIYAEKRRRCEVLIANLHGLSPTAKLVRGFGYLSAKGSPVTGVDLLAVGDPFSVVIHDGEIDARVTAVRKSETALNAGGSE